MHILLIKAKYYFPWNAAAQLFIGDNIEGLFTLSVESLSSKDQRQVSFYYYTCISHVHKMIKFKVVTRISLF